MGWGTWLGDVCGGDSDGWYVNESQGWMVFNEYLTDAFAPSFYIVQPSPVSASYFLLEKVNLPLFNIKNNYFWYQEVILFLFMIRLSKTISNVVKGIFLWNPYSNFSPTLIILEIEKPYPWDIKDTFKSFQYETYVSRFDASHHPFPLCLIRSFLQRPPVQRSRVSATSKIYTHGLPNSCVWLSVYFSSIRNQPIKSF